MKMVYLLGLTLLLLFKIHRTASQGSIAKAIGAIPPLNIFSISSSGSGFGRIFNKLATSNTDREMNRLDISKYDADTDSTVVSNKSDLKKATNTRKRRFTPSGLSKPNDGTIHSLNGSIATNARTEDTGFTDKSVDNSRNDAANVSSLTTQEKVPPGVVKRRRRPKSREVAQRRNGAINNVDFICEPANNETTTGSTGNMCTSNTADRNIKIPKRFSIITMKYMAQVFPFIVNFVSILFHSRRPNKTNVAMYVITMNVIELIAMTVGISWVLLYSNGLVEPRYSGQQEVTRSAMRFVDIWIKQGSYLAHLLLTIERFQVVKYPMHYTQIWNVSKAKWVLLTTILVFVVSHVIGVVSFAVVLRNQLDRTHLTKWSMMSGVLFTILPVITIVILNTTTSIVFYRQSRNIRQTCEGFTLVQVMRREKKMVTNLVITTTILILTSSPSTLWTMFLSQNDIPNIMYKMVSESFSTLSYFGNGLAFIILMALSMTKKCACCLICCPSTSGADASPNTPVSSTANRWTLTSAT